MDSTGTTSLAALFQLIDPAVGLETGVNSSGNQQVIDGEQFGALLQQLLGTETGAEGLIAGIDLGGQQLLPQEGEPLPLSILGISPQGEGASEIPQELLIENFKRLGLFSGQSLGEQQLSNPGTTILSAEPSNIVQASEAQMPVIPAALLMKTKANSNNGLPQTVVTETLDLKGDLKALSSGDLESDAVAQLAENDRKPIKPNEELTLEVESPLLQEKESVTDDVLKISQLPLMERFKLAGGAKDLNTNFSPINSLQSLQHMADGSARFLKPVNENSASGTTTNPGWGGILDAPMDSPQWKTEFGQRVVMLTKEGIQTAEVRLNPANLGPIEVRITLNDDQASINFSAHHSLTREAIEAAMPRLRELLQSNGLTLANAQVSEHSLRDHRERRQPESQFFTARSPFYGADESELNMSVVGSAYHPSVSHGLALAIDYYA